MVLLFTYKTSKELADTDKMILNSYERRRLSWFTNVLFAVVRTKHSRLRAATSVRVAFNTLGTISSLTPRSKTKNKVAVPVSHLSRLGNLLKQFSNSAQYLFIIIRQRASELHILPCCRVNETKDLCMQHLTLCAHFIFRRSV